MKRRVIAALLTLTMVFLSDRMWRKQKVTAAKILQKRRKKRQLLIP